MLAINILFLLAIMSCKKEGLPDPPPCTNCNTDTLLVWKHDLDTLTGEESLFVNPIFYKGNPVFIIYDPWDCNYGSAHQVTCLDASTGTKQWGFNLDDPCSSIRNAYIHNDMLFLNTRSELHGYNLNTLQKVWTINDANLDYAISNGMYGIGEYVYQVMEIGPPTGYLTSSLWQVHAPTGAYTELVRFDLATSTGNPSADPPALWLDPMTGDSVLIFAVNYTQSGQGPQAGTKSLYAFDLKAREYRWKVDSIGIPANNSRIPEVYDNKVYVPTEWRIHCFDLFTGNKIWEAEMPNNTQQIDFAFSRPLAVKGKLIANSTGDEMYCFDAFTGHVLWSVDKYTATANDDLLEHNGVVYLSSGGNGRFVGVDLETGEILLSIRSPNGSPSFAGYNVILNKEKNLLFLNDYKSAYAYKPIR